jgi:hypothetical protein
MDEQPDAQPAYSDFYEAFRRKTPVEKASLIWRMPEDAVICKADQASLHTGEIHEPG